MGSRERERKVTPEDVKQAKTTMRAVDLVLKEAGREIREQINGFVRSHRPLFSYRLHFGGTPVRPGDRFREYLEYDYDIVTAKRNVRFGSKNICHLQVA